MMRLRLVLFFTPFSMLELHEPTLLIDESKVEYNIQSLVDKMDDIHYFRPHFKTHQSRYIGQIFKRLGITKICVSSMKMAQYFHAVGWDDITIAFPFNIHQIDALNQLAQTCRVQVLVESLETIRFLQRQLNTAVEILIKMDAGYGRAGINYTEVVQVIEMAKCCQQSTHTPFMGLLAHFGNTYGVSSSAEVLSIYQTSLDRLIQVKAHIEGHGISCLLSIGDTPSSSCLVKFNNHIEYRPGNFVYYDVMQASNKMCSYDQIACVVACPIVAIHPDKSECVIHGGAVHFSKEFITNGQNEAVFGVVANQLGNDVWNGICEQASLRRISQEHGILQGTAEWIGKRYIGEWVYIYPIHSCLTVHAMRKAINTSGLPIDIM